jgi:hypothetical protein
VSVTTETTRSAGEHQFPLAGMMITQRETGDILAALIRKGSLKKLFRIAFTHPDLRSTGEIHLPASEKICPDVDEPVGIV